MEKYSIDELVIEVGRNCNMECPHCLRGERQNLTIKNELICKLLDSVDCITTLTITGGEPFLYPAQLNFIANELEKRNISICNFFVATNGTIKSFPAVNALMRLYDMSDDKYCCELKISNDEYHSTDHPIWDVLSCLNFTHLGGNIDEEYLISEGRAADNYYTTREVPDYDAEIDGNHINGMIYLAANGNILTACDYSYENQEKHAVGNLNSMSFGDIVKKIAADSPAA